MPLHQFLSENRSGVLERWLHLILEAYPAEVSKSFAKGKDRFTDPIGYTLAQTLEALYEGLLRGIGMEQLAADVDRILQSRSVQDFSPSQAVAIVPLIKNAIREEMKNKGVDVLLMIDDWFDLDSRIDQLSLLAFDCYSKHRDRINEIRVNEIKKERDRILKLLERSGTKAK